MIPLDEQPHERDSAASRQVTGRSLLISGGMVIGVRVAGASLMLVLLFVTARLFDASTLGATGVLWSVAVIGRVAGPIGLDVLGMRTIAPLWASGHEDRARESSEGDFRWLCRIHLPIIAVSLVTCSALLASSAPSAWVIATLGIACFSANAMQGLVAAQLRAAGRLLASQAPESIGIPLLAVGGTVALNGAGTLPVVVAQATAILLVAGWYCWARPGRGSPKGRSKHQWRSMAAVAVATMATAVATRAPVVFVALHGLHAAGLYDAGQRTQAIVALGVSSASVVVTPRLAVLVPAYRLRDAARLVMGAGVLAALPGGLMLGALLIFPNLMSRLLGTQFSTSQSIAVALLFAATVNALASLYGNFLVMMHGENAFAVVSIVHMTGIVAGALVASSPLQVAFLVLGMQFAREFSIVVVTVVHARKQTRLPRREFVVAG